MKTKSELCDWMRDNALWGNSCYVLINGGGISLCSPDEVEDFISQIMGDDYANDVVKLSKGEEYEDFKCAMKAEEYDSTDYFVKVEHLTGYNQENMDIQVQYWD